MINLQTLIEIPLDYWSIVETLGEIETRPMEYGHSEYYMDYADQFEEMANLAGYLYEDVERLRNRMERRLPPTKDRWFDDFASMIADTDMDILLKNGGNYYYEDVELERERQRKAIMRLTKEQICEFFPAAYNFFLQYLRLLTAYQTICGIIDELEYQHSFRERKGAVLTPPSADV